jgi:2-methylcitrate dehydratase PrpD
LGVSADKGVTEQIVSFVGDFKAEGLPLAVRHETVRAFVNAVGCMVGGAQHALVDTAYRALAEFCGPPNASLIGRGGKVDILSATLLNALAGAAYSFDDTYSEAMLHPAGPLIAALLALAERQQISGDEFVAAFAPGLEIACRLTKALSAPPAKPELAWSQTGIVCGISVALGAGKILGLSRDQLIWAVGIAASEASGTRLTHGSMAASLIFGHAAQTGLRAALLASHGFTSSPRAIEGRFGFASMYAKEANLGAIVDMLGVDYELLSNTYKPFPCGLVIHPALDGVLRLRSSVGLGGSEIERICLHVSPAAIEFGWRPEPKNNLEAKVSLHHWVAVAAATGRAGLSEGRIEMVKDAAIEALRRRVEVTKDPNLANDAARVQVVLADGSTHAVEIEHCVGSPERPMNDDELQGKFLGQAEPVIGVQKAIALSQMCWSLSGLADVGKVLELAS